MGDAVAGQPVKKPPTMSREMALRIATRLAAAVRVRTLARMSADGMTTESVWFKVTGRQAGSLIKTAFQEGDQVVAWVDEEWTLWIG